MMIALIDDRDAHAGIEQAVSHGQSAESGSNDDDTMRHDAIPRSFGAYFT
jgi:hypothetical protein